MTQIITRYFADAGQARKAKEEMVKFNRFSSQIIDIFDGPGGLSDALDAKSVAAPTAAAYGKLMEQGGAVMAVTAGYQPLGVAKLTRQITERFGGVEQSGLEEEVDIKDPPKLGQSILEGHPHILMVHREPDETSYHMADWPIPLINRRRPSPDSLAPRGLQLTGFALPTTIRRAPFSESIFPRHARMANFPIPLTSRRKPFTGSIFRRHARMANFPIRLISRRKPFSRSIFPRHQRMATVPFPLLIDGKTGTNALMPGGPRMANFPIRLISKRTPFTGSIFSRHARMANFPIRLTSRRKPFTGSLIPRHGRIADMFLPLTIRRTDVASKSGGSGFSFSKMLGLKTLTAK